MSDGADVIGLLSELIACPSVNPGRGAAGGSGGEARLAEMLAALLRGWGGEVRVTEVVPGRPNLVATFVGRGDGRSLMLEAHSDTVSVEGMTVPPFEATIRDGRLHGRGACDTKGPMAAMLAALRSVLDEGGPPGTVHFVSTCDEECGAIGASALMASGYRADIAVVGEPTGLEIVRAHKGALRWNIATRGRAAHSASPERGTNAIYAMADIVRALQRYAEGPLAARPHPLLGKPTLSVGTISGGTQANIVPEHCQIEVDRRLLPGESREGALAEMLVVLEPLRAAIPALDFSCEPLGCYPPFQEAPDGPAAALVAAACERALGRATFAVAPWASNAGFFGAAGIPCVVFGPGHIAQAHTADEFIEVEQLRRAVVAYAEIIRGAGQG